MMELENMSKEEEKKKQIEEQRKKRSDKAQNQFRIVVGKEANDALDGMVGQVNDGFTAGSVTKSDLATYLFKNAHRFLKKAEIVKIRTEYFDERLALENMVRESESSGKLPDDLRKLLKEQHRASLENLKAEF